MDNLDFQPVKQLDLYQNLIKNITGNQLVYQEVNEDENELNNIILNYYQLGERNIEDLTKLWIISENLHNAAFNYLSNELNLGYIVYSKVYNDASVDGLVICVQTEEDSPYEMNS